MLASLNGHSETVHILVNSDADVSRKANNGLTALKAATRKGHRNVVNILLEFTRAKAYLRIR